MLLLCCLNLVPTSWPIRYQGFASFWPYTSFYKGMQEVPSLSAKLMKSISEENFRSLYKICQNWKTFLPHKFYCLQYQFSFIVISFYNAT